jgi:hypothetical protein
MAFGGGVEGGVRRARVAEQRLGVEALDRGKGPQLGLPAQRLGEEIGSARELAPTHQGTGEPDLTLEPARIDLERRPEPSHRFVDAPEEGQPGDIVVSRHCSLGSQLHLVLILEHLLVDSPAAPKTPARWKSAVAFSLVTSRARVQSASLSRQ